MNFTTQHILDIINNLSERGERVDLSELTVIYDADLRGANLSGANLSGADGVVAVYGVGTEHRMMFCYHFEGIIHCQLGCFNGTQAETKAAIEGKYEDGAIKTAYLLSVDAMCAVLAAQLATS